MGLWFQPTAQHVLEFGLPDQPSALAKMALKETYSRNIPVAILEWTVGTTE